MKIYDISQEVLGCVVFPGDPAPQREVLATVASGGVCNLTAFSMCSHNGTHVDAPYHFLDDGMTVDQLPLSHTVGYAYVAKQNGVLGADGARAILTRAKESCEESAKRILLKDRAVVSLEAARVFAEEGVVLVGNESQTVGPEDAPMAVPHVLLGAGAALLEGIRLADVPEGVYLLSAAPLSFAGGDGAPCRAILISL